MLLSIILFCVLGALNSYAESFDFQVNNNGSYSLSVNDTRWLQSGPVFFNALGKAWSSDSADYPLTLTDVRNVTGGGITDEWYETQFIYKLGNTTTTVMVGIKRYNNEYPSKVLFTQTFVTGAENTSRSSNSQNETISGFPCFQVKDGDEYLGFLSYGGYMFGDTDMKMSTFDSSTDNINDGMTGGPLAIFNRAGKAVVISPYNNFMAASAWHINKPGGHMCWGIMGGVNEIPANFSYSTLLVYDGGINQAFETWGAQLRNQFGIIQEIQREELKRKDITLNYLGYWTDNGAYYYYNPENGKTYDKTLVDVKQFADNFLIPYKYIQLDSWWYAKDKDYSAVLTWTPTKTAFPSGLKNFTDRTDWPATMHNRYWSKDTPFAKANGGNYTFVMGNFTSLPNDQEFWRFLLSRAKHWGMIVYEQDWLNVQTEYLPQLQTSLTLGRDWLKQMATAAAENNITIQYCMSNPRHALQSLEFPVVTQARVSDDYLYETVEHRQPQWKVGVSSIFAKALRVQPYKDTFWTTTNQPGNPRYKNLTEPYPELESAVASLTAGPVGPGDMINRTGFGLIMKCCRRDGLLLKPSEPATAIDKQIIMDAFRPKGSPKIGDIWTTVSAITTNGRQTVYGVLFAADIQGGLVVGMDDLKFTGLTEGVYFPYNNNSAWGYFNSSTTIDLTGCSKKNFCLYYFSPFLKGKGAVEAILGETVKWIPMSSKRISYIHLQDDGTLDVNFTRVTEQVMPQIVYILHGKLWSRDCLLDPGVIPVCRLWEPSEINTRNSAFVPDVTCCKWIIYLFVAYICLMHQGIV